MSDRGMVLEYRNNAPTMSDEEVAEWERQIREGVRFGGRARTGAAHGTSNRYQHYGCRCGECRTAWRVYNAHRRAQKAVA